MGPGVAAKQLAWRCAGALDRVAGFSKRRKNDANAVLMYHSVGEAGRYGNVSPERFRKTISFLRERYDVVDLPDVLKDGGSKQVALTFDDGWENFYHHALPVLREFDAPATVFLVSEYLDSEPMLSGDQVRELVDDPLVTFGNHTRTHPHLSRIGNREALEDQILGAKDRLEDRFSIDVTRFSYPRGDWTGEAAELVLDSHEIGVSTFPRVADPRYLDEELGRALVPRIPAHTSPSRVRWELTDVSSSIRERASEGNLVTR